MIKTIPFGRVESVEGLTVIAKGPSLGIGRMCRLERRCGPTVWAEVIGFRSGGRLVLTPYGDVEGMAAGDLVIYDEEGSWGIPAGWAVLGRLIDALGQPLDDTPLAPYRPQPRVMSGIRPLERSPIEDPLWTGIRVIDGLLTLGQGQRIGIFAGAGLGKTTLLHQMVSAVSADVMVVALIGERGREVAEFYHQLLPSVRSRTVIVAATSDMPAILRVRAMDTAMGIAEQFRGQGSHVALVVDSLTRLVRARSEVGMAAGEPPALRGYTPSAFHMLPRVLERAGRMGKGSITGFYTILLESDDLDDPVGDAVRGILDGHIVLSRVLADAGHFPAIDVPKSLSRVMPQVVDGSHQKLARQTRELLARRDRARDLLELGAYQVGSDPVLDRALALWPALGAWLQQPEPAPYAPDQTVTDLQRILESEE